MKAIHLLFPSYSSNSLAVWHIYVFLVTNFFFFYYFGIALHSVACSILLASYINKNTRNTVSQCHDCHTQFSSQLLRHSNVGCGDIHTYIHTHVYVVCILSLPLHRHTHASTHTCILTLQYNIHIRIFTATIIQIPGSVKCKILAIQILDPVFNRFRLNLRKTCEW